MPITINSPNFWMNKLEQYLNESERIPLNSGSYKHTVPPNTQENTIDPFASHTLLPMPRAMANEHPRITYNQTLRIMREEAANNIIPYNNKDRPEEFDPDILEAVQNWIAQGKANRIEPINNKPFGRSTTVPVR